MFLRFWFLMFLATCTAAAAPRFELVRRAPVASKSILIEGLDGAIYGSTDNRSIFRLGRSGSFRMLYRFDEGLISSLITAPDGNLYGTIGDCVFRLSYVGALDVLHDFGDDPSLGNVRPHSLALASDGNIYGITFNTAVSPYGGQLFRVRLDGQLTKIVDFPSVYSSVVSIVPGADGALWALSTLGLIEASHVFRVNLAGGISSPITRGNVPGFLNGLLAHPDGSFYSIVHRRVSPFVSSLVRFTTRGEAIEIKQFDDPMLHYPLRATMGNDGRIYFGAPDFERRGSRDQILSLSSTGDLRKVIGPLGGSLLYVHEMPPLITHDGWLYVASSGPNRKDGVIARARLSNYPAGNMVPLARPDYLRPPNPGEGRWIDLLANDFDANRDPISLLDVSTPKHGTVEVDAALGRVRYTAPAGDPVIEDTFSYRISDGNGGIGIGTVMARADIRGPFSSLLESSVPEEDGRIGVTLNRSGALSGQLWLAGLKRRFAGNLDGENRFSVTFSGLAPLYHGPKTLTLELRADGSRPILAAELKDRETTFEANLTRPNLSVANNRAGKYTFALPSNTAWSSRPARISDHLRSLPNPVATALGDGFGVLRLSRNGIATVVGKMPDGASFSAGLTLGASGQLLFFAPLYLSQRKVHSDLEHAGWLRGPVDLGETSRTADLEGNLRWVLPHGHYFTHEFLHAGVQLVGSRYVRPENLQIALGNAPRFRVDEGGGVAPFTASTFLDADVISGVAPFRMKGAFSSNSGLLGGHFSPKGTSIWLGYNGVLLQKQRRAVGQFRPISRLGTAGFLLTSQ